MNPVALFDALDCAGRAVITAETGNVGEAEAAFTAASRAAGVAFPPGPLADALFLILGSAGDFVNGVPA